MTQEEFRNTWLPLSDALYRVAFYMLEDGSAAAVLHLAQKREKSYLLFPK